MLLYPRVKQGRSLPENTGLARDRTPVGQCLRVGPTQYGPRVIMRDLIPVHLFQGEGLAVVETFYSPQKGPGNCTRPLPSASEDEEEEEGFKLVFKATTVN